MYHLQLQRRPYFARSVLGSDAKSAEKRLLKERQRKQQRSGNSRSLSNTEIVTVSTLDNSTNAKDNTSVEAAPEVKRSASSSASSEETAIGVTSLSVIVPLPRSITSKSLFNQKKTSRHEKHTDRIKQQYERDVSGGRSDRAESNYIKEMERLDRQRSSELENLEKEDKEVKAHWKMLWI